MITKTLIAHAPIATALTGLALPVPAQTPAGSSAVNCGAPNGGGSAERVTQLLTAPASERRDSVMALPGPQESHVRQEGGGRETGSVERLWQQGSDLYDRNEFRNAFRPVSAAARQGDPRAQSLLGIMYQNGEGVKADERQAAYWFGQAAAQRHRAARYAPGAISAFYAAGKSGGQPCPSCVQELEQKRVWQANEAAGIHNHIP